MTTPLKLLLVEDSQADAKLLAHVLRQGGYEPNVTRVETKNEMLVALRDPSFEIVVSDYRLPTFSGMDALACLRQTGVDLPFIIVSGTVGESNAVEAMKAGAHDYVMKDNLLRLPPAIGRELQEAGVRRRRREAEHALRESEQRFRALADSAPVLIWITDGNGRFTYLNKTWLDFTGSVFDGEVGADSYAHVNPADLDDYRLVRESAAEAQEAYQTEYRLCRHDGEWRWMLETGTPRNERSAEFAGFIGTCVDITDRKQAELERELIQREKALLLEEKTVAAQQQRAFLKDVLLSVTEGKLHLCDMEGDLPKTLLDESEEIPISDSTLFTIRQAAERVALEYGLSRERTMDIVTAVGEASMNAVVHAGGGTACVYGAPCRVQIWVTDRGRGIDINRLPRATLERGFTTASSLGHGFFMMLGCADRLYLLTGSSGTTVVLEQFDAPPIPAWLERSF